MGPPPPNPRCCLIALSLRACASREPFKLACASREPFKLGDILYDFKSDVIDRNEIYLDTAKKRVACETLQATSRPSSAMTLGEREPLASAKWGGK
jgi:hypothetical protein